MASEIERRLIHSTGDNKSLCVCVDIRAAREKIDSASSEKWASVRDFHEIAIFPCHHSTFTFSVSLFLLARHFTLPLRDRATILWLPSLSTPKNSENSQERYLKPPYPNKVPPLRVSVCMTNRSLCDEIESRKFNKPSCQDLHHQRAASTEEQIDRYKDTFCIEWGKKQQHDSTIRLVLHQS